jgi:hypothetical protein
MSVSVRVSPRSTAVLSAPRDIFSACAFFFVTHPHTPTHTHTHIHTQPYAYTHTHTHTHKHTHRGSRRKGGEVVIVGDTARGSICRQVFCVSVLRLHACARARVRACVCYIKCNRVSVLRLYIYVCACVCVCVCVDANCSRVLFFSLEF